MPTRPSAAAAASLRRARSSWGGRPVLLYGFDDLTEEQLDLVAALDRRLRGHGRRQLRGSRGARRRGPSCWPGCATSSGGDGARTGSPSTPATRRAPPCATSISHLFEAGAGGIEPDGGIALLECGGERGEAEAIGGEVARLLADAESRDDIVVVLRHPESPRGAVSRRVLDGLRDPGRGRGVGAAGSNRRRPGAHRARARKPARRRAARTCSTSCAPARAPAAGDRRLGRAPPAARARRRRPTSWSPAGRRRPRMLAALREARAGRRVAACARRRRARARGGGARRPGAGRRTQATAGAARPCPSSRSSCAPRRRPPRRSRSSPSWRGSPGCAAPHPGRGARGARGGAGARCGAARPREGCGC